MQDSRLSRRALLRLATLGLAGAVLAACQRAVTPLVGTVTPLPSPTPAVEPTVATGATPAATPTAVPAASVPVIANEHFYRVATGPDPQVPADWKLTITGLVAQPLTLTLDDLWAMPAAVEMRTFSCIENPVGGDLISNAYWKGVRLRDVLARAGVKTDAHYIELDSVDGYSTGIPLELGLDEHALLAYEMNGVPLPLNHGAPLRCLWPGRYGMKQPKWLEKITLLEKIYIGYWEVQGWSNEARTRPFSRIDVPRDDDTIKGPVLNMNGLAFADDSGVAKVEVSWDDTDEWHAADLVHGPTPLAWTVWKWSGPSLSPDRHVLLVRCTDGHGKTQTRGRLSNYLGGAFPAGTDQIHSISVKFES